MRTLALGLVAALFVAAGVLHFVRPGPYVRTIPPLLPFALVYVSGTTEILGGIGVLVPGLRTWAGLGLVALPSAFRTGNRARQRERIKKRSRRINYYFKFSLRTSCRLLSKLLLSVKIFNTLLSYGQDRRNRRPHPASAPDAGPNQAQQDR